ncbi:MAG: hypothetical protein IT301_13465 [Dehalococcoidia bacterium]|nr:hypothetical protein [Dehalococcoidia bacterium]
MIARKTTRREVRLDPESDSKLEEQLRRRGVTFADWVREQIQRAEDYERAAEVSRILSEFAREPLNVPDLATLREEVNSRVEFRTMMP